MKELEDLLDSGQLTKLEEIGEHISICVSTAVLAKKIDGSVKIAFLVKELSERIVNKKMQMLNLDDLRDSAGIAATVEQNSAYGVPKFDLDWTFGQAVITKNTVTW